MAASVRVRKLQQRQRADSPKQRNKANITTQPVPSEAVKIIQSDNPYILSGFRDYAEGSFMECSKSVFHVHNDTMNIWTHILGGFWAILALYEVLFSPLTSAGSFSDKIIFTLFLTCSTACFSASAAYHIFRSHSVEMYKLFLLFDVGAIAFQLFGSVLLITYFEMSCHSNWRSTWLISLLSLFSVTVATVPYLMRHRRYNIRTMLLTTFALSGLAAHFHRMSFDGFKYSAKDVLLYNNC